jgi:hypothetical protein
VIFFTDSPAIGAPSALTGDSHPTNPIIMAHMAMHMKNTFVFIIVFLFSVQSYTNILILANKKLL